MFEELLGRPPVAPKDTFEVRDAATGRRHQLAYTQPPSHRSKHLSLRSWVQDVRPRPCDHVAFKRQGGELLIKLVPDDEARAADGWVGEGLGHVCACFMKICPVGVYG
jgi:hypothetical protein